MNFLGCVFATLLAVTPQANLTVIGPDKVQAGAVVAFDGGQSHSDFPLAWSCSPREGAMLRQFPDGAAWFIAGKPGTYNVVLVASGWKDSAKTSLDVAVASQTITVTGPNPFPPNPPSPPEPTDPLAKAALQYKRDLVAAYGVNYGTAATKIRARIPLKTVQPDLKTAMGEAARSSYERNFNQWSSQFPPNGTEPTTEAQWKIVGDVMDALSGAFK